jgi:hypothetical protein
MLYAPTRKSPWVSTTWGLTVAKAACLATNPSIQNIKGDEPGRFVSNLIPTGWWIEPGPAPGRHSQLSGAAKRDRL